jgi:putative endonuclease
MKKLWYVYILASQRNGTLYVWVTSNLSERISQHKSNLVEWFTQKYKIHTLVYYEIFETFTEALVREKVLKWIKRNKKIEIIESHNPTWKDLTFDL